MELWQRRRVLAWSGLLGAVSACAPASSWAPLDASGSTITVAPANLVAGDKGCGAVRVALHRADGGRVAGAGLQVAVTAEGCAVGPAAAVDDRGEVTVALGPCRGGRHVVRAALFVQDLVVPLPAGAAVNAYQPAAGSAEAIAAGARVDLAIDAGYAYVGAVRFVSSDPLAQLPGPVTLPDAAHGVLHLSGQARLLTPGLQTIAAIDALTGRPIDTEQLMVAAPAPGGADGASGGAALALTAPPEVVAGDPFAVAVVALDPAGQAVASGPGDLVLGADDAQARLPAAPSRAATAHAAVISGLVLPTAGVTTLTAQAASGQRGTARVRVRPGAAVRLWLRPLPGSGAGPFTAGTGPILALGGDDRFGNAVDDLVGAVRIASSDAGARLPALVPPAPDGRGPRHVAVVLATAGKQTVTAIAASGLRTSWAQDVVAGLPTRLVLQVPPATVGTPVAGLRVAAADAYGNAVGGFAGAVLLHSDDAGAVLPGPLELAAADVGPVPLPGTATFARAGLVTVVATARAAGDGATLAPANQIVQVAPVAASVAQVALVPLSTTAVADGVEVLPLVLTATDAQGRPAAYRPVALTASPSSAVAQAAATAGPGAPAAGAGGGSGQPVPTTDLDGALTLAVRSVRAGPASVTATVDGVAAHVDVAFAAGEPVPKTSTLAVAPSGLVADGVATATVSLAIRDAQGNPVAGAPVTVTSNVGSDVVAASGGTDGDGRLALPLRATAAGMRTVTARIGTMVLAAQVGFMPGPPAATATRLTASPQRLAADGVAASTIALLLADARGNPISGQPVALSVSGSGNLLAASPVWTDAQGLATTTLQATVTGARTVRADVGPASFVAPVEFTAGPAVAGRTTVGITPDAVPADGVAAAMVTLIAQDGAGRPAAGQAVVVTTPAAAVTIDSPRGRTDDRGRFQTSLRSRLAGPQPIVVRAGDAELGAQATFVAGLPATATSRLRLAPAQVRADGATPLAIEVAVADAQGNPVPGAAIMLSSSGSGNLIQASDPVSGTTGTDGRLRAVMVSTRAEPKLIVASTAGALLTGSVEFVAGPVDTAATTFTAAPGSAPADGTTPIALRLAAADLRGNPVAGVAVALTTIGGAAALWPASGRTAADGTFTATMTAGTAGARTVVATVVGAAAPARITVTFGGAGAGGAGAGAGSGVGSASAASSTLILVPAAAPVPADGTSGVTLALHLADAAGAALVGEAVTFSISGAGNTLALVAPVDGRTDAAGNLLARLVSTQAENKSLTAAAAGIALSGSVQFVAAAPSAAASSLLAVPATLLADGAATTVLTATLRDAQGNPVPGVPVQFATGAGSDVLSPTGAVSDLAGVATARLAVTQAGARTVTAAFAGIALSAPVACTAGPVTAGSSALLATPAVVPADGQSAAQIAVQARDAAGNPVAGLPVNLSSSGSGNAFAAASGRTDAGGRYLTTMTSTTAQAKTIAATAGGVSLGSSVTFAPGAPVTSTSTVTLVPATVAADGSTAATIGVQVRDAQGNGVPGVAVTLTSSGTGNDLSPAAGTTAPDGTLSAALTSTVAEVKAVSASFAGTSIAGQATFLATAAQPAGSSVVALPAAVVADGQQGATLVATLRDARGNPVSATPVTFTVSGSSNALSTTSALTNAAGVASVALTSTRAETKVVTATFPGGAVNGSVSFGAGALSPVTSRLAASPPVLAADGVAATTVTATARDARGNPLVGQAVTFASSGSGDVWAPPTAATDATGSASMVLRATVAEPKSLTATVAGTTLAAVATFTATAGASATSRLTASPTSATADGASSIVLTVAVRDAQGNPVPGAAVALAVSGSNNVLSPPSGTTGTTGTFAATLQSTTAEAKLVTASFGATSVTTTVSLVPGVPASSTSQLVAVPSAPVADGAQAATLTAQLRDGHGNPVPGYEVTFHAGGSGNVLSAPTATTSAAGTAAVELRATHAEPKVVTASFAGTSVATTVTYLAGAVDAGGSSLAVTPATVPADGTTPVALRVRLVDGQGNPVAGQPVGLACTGSGHTLSPTSGSTGNDGTFTAALLSTVAETKTVTASAAGIVLPASVNFAAGAPATSTSSVTATPASSVADGSSAITLLAQLRDLQNNPVSGQPITFGVSGSGNGLTPAFGTSGADGTFAAQLTTTTPETKSVTVNFAGTSLVTSVPFVAAAQSSGNSQLVASPATPVADGTHLATLTATIRDAQNNPVVGEAVSFSCSGTQNNLSATTATTGDDGTAQITLASTRAEAKTVTASAAGGSVATTVTFLAGPVLAAASTLSVSPGTVVADGAAPATVTVVARDADGNAVPGQPVLLTVGGTDNQSSATSGTTDAAGSFTATVRSTRAEAKAVTATVAGRAIGGLATFVAGAASPANSTLVASPAATVADGSRTAVLTATIRDGNGNPVAGAALSFASSGSGNTLVAAGGTTSTAGTLVATLATTVAETKTLSASFVGGTVTGATTFVAGPAVTAKSAVVATPGSVLADGAAVATLVATLRDSNGNPVPGQAVSFASSGSGNTLSATTATTATDGTAAVTLASTQAEQKTITAGFAGTAVTTTVGFAAGTVVAGNSAVAFSPPAAIADGTATTTLVVSARDGRHNPVPNQPVTIAVQGSGNTLNPSAGSTDADGRLAATLSATVAEIKTVTVTVGGATLEGAVTFLPGLPSSGASTLTVAPLSVAADGSSAAALTITVADGRGNPVPGVTVALTASGSNNAFTPASATTSASGTVAATLTSTTAEQKVVTASFAGTSVSAPACFVAAAPSPATSRVVAGPTTALADGVTAMALSATIRDAQGNAVAGVPVAFTASGAANTFSAPSAITDAAGNASVGLASTKAESKAITATFGGASVGTTVSFVPGPVAAGTSSLAAAPAGVAADGVAATTLTAQLRDAQGNVVPGQAVSFAASGGGNGLSPPSGTSNAAGIVTAALRSTVAGSKTVTATAAGVAVGTTASFVATAPVAAQSSFTVGGSPAVAGAGALTLRLYLADAQGNPVPGVAVALATTGSGNVLTPTDGSTDQAGSFVATLSSTVAEHKALTASFAGDALGGNATVVAGPPATSTSALSASPGVLVANGAATATLTATLRDALGNPVAGVPVLFASSGSGNTLGAAGATTAANGGASVTLASTTAETKAVTASFAGTSVSTSVTFVAGAVAAATSTLSANPVGVVADGVALVAVAVHARDAGGNPVAGAPVALTSSGSGNAFGAATGATGGDGTFTTTLSSTVAQGKALSATVGGASLGASATFVPGAAVSGTSTLVLTPAAVAADGTAVATAALQLRDAQGNATPGVAVTLSSSGTGNALSPSSGTTSGAGTLAATLASTVAENKTVTASFNGTAIAAQAGFVATAPVAATSTVGALPAAVVADNVATTTLVATLRDVHGNAVPGRTVTFSSSGSGNTLGSTTATTDGTGAAAVALASTRAEAKTITASFDGTSVSTMVSFIPGPVAQATSTLAASPLGQPADGVAATTLVATARDARGNVVAGQAVSFAASGSGSALAPTTATTDAAGVATATLRSTVAQPAAASATVAGATLSVSVPFVAAAPAAATSTVTASPTATTADGASAMALLVQLRDGQGNPAPGVAVTLSISGSNNALAPATGTTGADGTLTALLTSTSAESKLVTASFAGTAVTTTVSFVAGIAASSTSQVVASPATTVANGVSATTLSATVRDAKGNAVPGQQVSFASSGTGNALSAPTATTSAAGVAAVNLISTRAEVKAITASFAGTSVGTAATFVPGPPAAAQSSLTASPAALTADGAAATTVTVIVADAQGNPVPGQAVTLASTGSGHVLAPTSGTTGAAGTLSATLTSTVAESKSLTATVAGLTLPTTATFLPGPAVAAASTWTATPASTTADGASTVVLALHARDAQGNAVPGQAVSLTATGSGNVLTPATGTTAADGTWSASLAATVPETKTITASFAGTAKAVNATFVPGPPSGPTSQLAASPSTVVADGTHVTTLVATVRDAQGNPLSGQGVAFSSSGAGNALSAPNATTTAAGTATVTMVSTVAEAKTVTATTSVGSLTTGVTFVPGPVVVATSALTASPASVVADGAATTTVTVQARDAQGNPVPGQAVALTAGGTGNALSAASGATGAAGTFVTTLASTVAESKALGATVAGVALAGSANFVAGGAVAGTSSLAASPANTVADGVATTTVTAVVRDARGNPVPGVAVTLSSSGGGDTLSPAAGTTSVAGTLSATLASTTAGAKAITATFAGLTVSGSTTFVPGPAVSSTSTIATAPTAVTADGSTTTTLTATLRDAQGNVVPGQAVTFASSGSGNTLSATSGTTASTGTATATMRSTVAEAKTITVGFGGTSIAATLNFLPGAVAVGTSSLTASPATLAADGTATATITVLARDAQNNPVPAQPVALASSGSGNVLTPTTGSTGAAGTFTATMKSTTAQAKALSATAGGAALAGTLTFVPGAPASTASTLVVSPTSVTADGSSTTALLLTVRDLQNNPVPGVAVALACSGSNNTVAPTAATTSASGQVSATLTSTTAEQKTVTASFAGTTVGTPVIFVAGAPVQATSQLVASPAAVTADGQTAMVLTATLRDAQGNGVAGQTVTFSSSGTGNGLSAASATTGVNGSAAVGLTSTRAESKTVTAAFASTAVTATASFVAGAVATSNSSVSASPTSVVADNSATTAVTVLLRDAQNNPVPGIAVTLAAGGTGNTLSATSGTTGSGGTVVATLRSSVAESKALTAMAAGLTLGGTATFSAGAAVQTTSSVVASPTTLTANGSNTAALVVQIRDAQGNPVPGVAVALSSSGTGNTLTPASGTTGANGTLMATMASTVAEAKTVTATFAATSVATPVTFVAGPAVSGTSAFTASPALITADGAATTTLTATVRDAQGNPVPGQVVTFASSGTGNGLSATSATTAATGVATATLASTKAEIKTLTASFAGTSLMTSATFAAGAPAASTSTLVVSPTTVVADGTTATTVTLTLADAQGNPAPGLAVTLASSGSGNVLSATSGSTGAAGTFVATLKSTVAQSKTLTAVATASGVTKTTTTTFAAGPAASGSSSLTPTGAPATADGATAVTFGLVVADAQGNPVPGQAVAFAASGSGNTLSATSGTTSASGTASLTLRSTVAQAKTVTASFAGTSVSAAASFLAGPAAVSTSAVTTSPSAPVADGSMPATVVVALRDAQGNAVTAQALSVAASGSGNTLSASSGSTDAAGLFTVTLSSITAEAKTVTATFGGLTSTATITFVPGAPVTSTSSFAVSPTTIATDGTSAATLTATLRDARGNAVPGQAVAFSASGTGNTLVPASATTSAAGVAAAQLASSKPETKALTAAFAGTTLTAVLTVVNDVVAGLTGPTPQGSPPYYTGRAIAFQTTATDRFGNLVLATPPTVHFTSTDAAATLPADVTMTGASLGVATAPITLNTAGTWTVTASAGSPGAASHAATIFTNRVVALSGNQQRCALLGDATLKCWGLNGYSSSAGILGLGDATHRGTAPGQMGPNLPVVNVGTGRTVRGVAAGETATCALLDNYAVKCWGNGGDGMLGYGDTVDRGATAASMGDALPALSLGTGRSARAVYALSRGACARLDNSAVKCWGHDASGENGAGDTVARGTAAGQMGDALPALSFGTSRTALEVFPGWYHACARLDNAGLKCWGKNGQGELGIGDPNDRGSAPSQMGDSLPAVDLGAGRTAVTVAAGYVHTCAVLDDGTVRCWGYNADGELGLGDTLMRGSAAGQMGSALPPVNLGTGRTATALATNISSTCALLDNGTVKCWGYNANGVLGVGDTVTRGTAAGQMGDALPAVPLGTGAVAVGLTGGWFGTCARLSDGSAKCWGANDFGQLGQGDTTGRGGAAGQMGDALPPVVLW